MFHETLNDVSLGIFTLIVMMAAYQDIKTFTISNSFSLTLIILYPAFVLTAGTTPDWLLSAGISAAALIVGFALFAFKFCGGGDAKLFAAVCLWAGPDLFVNFFTLTALTGGAIAISLWLLNRVAFLIPFLPQGLSSDPETFAKKPMPYGAAIALGAVYVAFTLLR